MPKCSSSRFFLDFGVLNWQNLALLPLNLPGIFHSMILAYKNINGPDSGEYKVLIFVDNYRGISSRSRPPEEESQRNDDNVEEINKTVDTNNYIYLKSEEIIEFVDINNDTTGRSESHRSIQLKYPFEILRGKAEEDFLCLYKSHFRGKHSSKKFISYTFEIL